MKRLFAIILTLDLLVNISLAQSGKYKNGRAPFVLGVVDTIHSSVLKEERILNIYLPEGYDDDSSGLFPVIYLLDGTANEDFIHVVGIMQFRTMLGLMPKAILVGIANVDRKRDFSFPTTVEEDKKEFPTTGGSADFIAFIEKELQPFVQRKLKTNNRKAIIGQSLGGLLATEILLKKPTLFNDYIIVSPSLWWDKESLLHKAQGQVAKFSYSDTRVYISVGTEEAQMMDNAKQLYNILKAAGKNDLDVNFVPLLKEDHLTILHNSVYRAFEILYPGK